MTGLRRMPARREAALRGHGLLRRGSTFAARTAAAVRGWTGSGPTRHVRDLVEARSGGWCEWPRCRLPAADVHHRRNRKQGGRRGEARKLLNGAAWLLHVCRPHHRAVTSPSGQARTLARAVGWLLLEHEDATVTPARTRHAPGLVLLDDDGRWRRAARGDGS